MNILNIETYKQDDMMIRFFPDPPHRVNSVGKRFAASNNCDLKDQNGFVLITALMILVVTTLLGIAALDSSTFEMKISGIEKMYQRQFFYSDAGINAMLGEDNRPSGGFLPAAFGVPLDASGDPVTPITCNDLQGMSPFVSYDVDGDATTPTTKLYYLQRLSPTPFEVEVLSCARSDNSIAGITAGVRFGSGPINPGNPTSY